MEQHDLHQELRAAAQARFDALEPFARESQRALDEAYYLVVLHEAEATLSSPNLTDKLKSAVSSACEAACLLVGLDHSNFILCGGRDKTEPLLDAIRKQLDSDLQPSPEALVLRGPAAQREQSASLGGQDSYSSCGRHWRYLWHSRGSVLSRCRISTRFAVAQVEVIVCVVGGARLGRDGRGSPRRQTSATPRHGTRRQRKKAGGGRR